MEKKKIEISQNMIKSSITCDLIGLRVSGPIHGDVHLDELATRVIASPEFRMLDGIRELGFAYFVHTRPLFEGVKF